ncbi:MAG: hypothetical protein J0H53_25030 [Rhizobiales bacterium]|nr:hypothetical protein [Hyphomicrobiales bacterium]
MNESSPPDGEKGAGKKGRQETYLPFLKERALKILQDYSLETGRKAHTIRREIIALVAPRESEESKLLTRQDLENWFRCVSVLGDNKFRLVFEFLTHPLTLERTDFRNAKSLLDPLGEIFDVGKGVSRFYGSQLNYTDYMSNEMLRRMLDGLYKVETRKFRIILSLNYIEGKEFMIAHCLTSLVRGTSADPMFKVSGFATFGESILFHMRDARTKKRP